MLNLLPAIKGIKEEIDRINKRYRAELKPYEESLGHLLEINEACHACNGTGKVFRRACAEDEGDYYTCEDCHGTGRR